MESVITGAGSPLDTPCRIAAVSAILRATLPAGGIVPPLAPSSNAAGDMSGSIPKSNSSCSMLSNLLAARADLSVFSIISLRRITSSKSRISPNSFSSLNFSSSKALYTLGSSPCPPLSLSKTP